MISSVNPHNTYHFEPRAAVESGASIRLATLVDFDGARGVQHAALPEEHRYDYAKNIRVANCFNIVAEKDSEIVGYASVLLTRWNPQGSAIWQRVAPYIAFLGIVPLVQGKKLGSEMVRTIVDAASKLCPSEEYLYLEHAINNPRVHGLYEKIGFLSMSEQEVRSEIGITSPSTVMRIPLRVASS